MKSKQRMLTAGIALLVLASCDTTDPSSATQGQLSLRSRGLRAGIESVDPTLSSRNDTDLLGVDEDHNGVRDDVDALVKSISAKTPADLDPFVNTMYATLAELVTEGMFVDLNDKTKVLRITEDQMLAFACIGSLWRYARGLSTPGDPGISNTINDAVLNTKVRYKADRALWHSASRDLISAKIEFASTPCLRFR